MMRTYTMCVALLVLVSAGETVLHTSGGSVEHTFEADASVGPTLHEWAVLMNVPEYGYTSSPPFGLPLTATIWLSFEPDDFYVLLEVEPPSVVGSAKECSVRCGDSGYYACCLVLRGEPVCRCRRQTQDDQDCQAGGEGADECGITRDDP